MEIAAKKELSLTSSLPEQIKQYLTNEQIDWGGFYERRGSMQGRGKVPQLTRQYVPVIDSMIEEIKKELAPINDSESDKREMKACFVGLASLFPMQDIGDEGFSMKFSILAEVFKIYPISALREACVDFAKTGEWFPRPKELIDRIDSIVGKKNVRIKRLTELKDKIK